MLYAILGILAFALQNTCCKEYGNRYPGTVFAQSVMTVLSLVVVVAIMAALGGVQALTPEGYLIAFAFGVFFVLTLITMTMAMNSGHLGITLLIQNSSLMVPSIFGMIAWGEKLNMFKGLGILFILALLALSAGDNTAAAGSVKNWNKKRWLVLTGLAFFGDGILGILQGLMSRASAETSSNTFTFWTSIFSIVVAGAVYLVLRMRGQGAKLTRDKKDALAFTGLISGIGVGTAGGNSFSILALTQLPGLVFFPLRQGGLVLVMWLVGILLYKEKVTRRGLIMLATGMLGLILINLG